MPVPSTMADLTTSEATNSPADSETVTATTRPSDYLRAHAAILKTHSASTAEHGATGAVVGTTNTQTLTNKTVDLASNTLTGTTAQFNTALSDGDFATLAGTETLTNKTISGGTVSGITDLAVADGGTGASTASAALANLGAQAAITVTASRALVSDTAGKVAAATATAAEVGFLAGVTSAIQTQIDGKLGSTAKAADADKLDGYDSATADTVSTVALRDASGDITMRLPRTTYGVTTTPPAATAEVVFRNSSTDNYHRTCTRDAFKSYIGAGTETTSGLLELATAAEAAAGTDANRVVTAAGLRSGLNAAGTAPVYACRAWVNFNGTGTVAIRAAGNVGSITDNGTGDYTLNFTTAMQDANYSINGMVRRNDVNGDANVAYFQNSVAPTASAVRISCSPSSVWTPEDMDIVSIAVFR